MRQTFVITESIRTVIAKGGSFFAHNHRQGRILLCAQSSPRADPPLVIADLLRALIFAKKCA